MGRIEEFKQWVESLRSDKMMGELPVTAFSHLSTDEEEDSSCTIVVYNSGIRLFLDKKPVDIIGPTEEAFALTVRDYADTFLDRNPHTTLASSLLERSDRVGDLIGNTCTCSSCGEISLLVKKLPGGGTSLRLKVREDIIDLDLEQVAALATIFYRLAFNIRKQALEGMPLQAVLEAILNGTPVPALNVIRPDEL